MLTPKFYKIKNFIDGQKYYYYKKIQCSYYYKKMHIYNGMRFILTHFLRCI